MRRFAELGFLRFFPSRGHGDLRRLLPADRFLGWAICLDCSAGSSNALPICRVGRTNDFLLLQFHRSKPGRNAIGHGVPPIAALGGLSLAGPEPRSDESKLLCGFLDW